jgi:hypothetical protein
MTLRDSHQKHARESLLKADEAERRGDHAAARRHRAAAKQSERLGATNPLRGKKLP